MKLLIAERSLILRKRLTSLFSDLGFISLFALVEELKDVKKMVSEVKPDVIVIDMDFPNRDNLHILTALKEGIKTPKILLLTETAEPRHIEQFQHSGVDMVFNKKDDLGKLIGQLNLMDYATNNTTRL